MNLGREGIVIAVGAVVALLLQIVVAPNIALFSAQPNFLLAYVLVVAIARPLDAGSALPFALGSSATFWARAPSAATRSCSLSCRSSHRARSRCSTTTRCSCR